MKARIKNALFKVTISVAVNAVISALFGFILKSDNFWSAYKFAFAIFYGLFFGGYIIEALMLVITAIPEKETTTLSMIFYYSTLLLCSFLSKHMDIETALIISAVIAALISYIYWLKELKWKYEEHD